MCRTVLFMLRSGLPAAMCVSLSHSARTPMSLSTFACLPVHICQSACPHSPVFLSPCPRSQVKGGTGEGLSLVLQAGAAIIAGMIIAFVANWRLALVVAAIFPLMVLTSLLQGQAFKGYAQGQWKERKDGVDSVWPCQACPHAHAHGRVIRSLF